MPDLSDVRASGFGVRQKMQNCSIVPKVIAPLLQRRVQNIIHDPMYAGGSTAKAGF
jgi:hypothetical protein